MPGGSTPACEAAGARLPASERCFVRRVEKIRGRLGRASHRATAPGQELRQGGVYSLPDGTELVAAAAPGGRHLLYHPRVWAGHARVVEKPVAYVVTPEGHIFTSAGRLTPWRVEDLTDLRRTAVRGGRRRALL
jgi:hypothetical protein